MNRLPIDMSIHWCEFLSCMDLVPARSVSKSWRELVDAAMRFSLWRSVLLLVYGTPTAVCDWNKADRLIALPSVSESTDAIAARGLLLAERTAWSPKNGFVLYNRAMECFKEAADRGHFFARLWFQLKSANEDRAKLIAELKEHARTDPYAAAQHAVFTDDVGTQCDLGLNHGCTVSLHYMGNCNEMLLERKYPPALYGEKDFYQSALERDAVGLERADSQGLVIAKLKLAYRAKGIQATEYKGAALELLTQACDLGDCTAIKTLATQVDREGDLERRNRLTLQCLDYGVVAGPWVQQDNWKFVRDAAAAGHVMAAAVVKELDKSK